MVWGVTYQLGERVEDAGGRLVGDRAAAGEESGREPVGGSRGTVGGSRGPVGSVIWGSPVGRVGWVGPVSPVIWGSSVIWGGPGGQGELGADKVDEDVWVEGGGAFGLEVDCEVER